MASVLPQTVTRVMLVPRFSRILRIGDNTKKSAYFPRMNNSKASGLAAVHVKPHGGTKSGTAPAAATDMGWDPFEVWRTRVLEQRREPRVAEARGDSNAKPFLVRTT